MRQTEILNSIRNLVSRFITELNASTAMGHYDINVIAENVLIPIFKLAYDYNDLVNANTIRTNFPSVDLVDKVKRVAIQVTSDGSIAKIRHTLEMFKKHNLEPIAKGPGDERAQMSLPASQAWTLGRKSL